MNPPRPSLNFQSDPGTPCTSRFNNNWIYQKTCYLCYVALGCGQHRERKLYCRMCRRAICQHCAAEEPQPGSKESRCKACEGRGSESRMLSARVSRGLLEARRYSGASGDHGGDETEEQANRTVEDALQSAKFVLEDLKSSQHSRTAVQMTQKSSALLAKLQSQLTEYDTELVDVKRTVGFYAEQLDLREVSIETMTTQMQVLTHSNSSLEQRVSTLEQALGQLSERSSELPEAKSEHCLHCRAF